MQPSTKDAACLWDMLEAARNVVAFTSGIGFEQYRIDPMRQRAVERVVEIIGEAARKVSQEFQQAHPEIPWKKIMAQRHVLAHEYGEIRQDRLWSVATTHVPELIGLLEPLLPPLPEDR